MIPMLVVYVLVVLISFITGGYICVAIDRRRDWPDTDLAAEWDDQAPEDVTEAIAKVPADWDVTAEPEPVTGRVLAEPIWRQYPEPEWRPDDTDRLASTGELWLFRQQLSADEFLASLDGWAERVMAGLAAEFRS
jgi:hypothetical protein